MYSSPPGVSHLHVSASSAVSRLHLMRRIFHNEGTTLLHYYIKVFLDFFIASSMLLLPGVNGVTQVLYFLPKLIHFTQVIHVEHFLHEGQGEVIGLHSFFVQI